MKRKIRVSVFILAFCISLGGFTNSQLAEVFGDVEQTNQISEVILKDSFTFIPESSDLFQNMKKLMPGGCVYQDIEVTNSSKKNVRITLKSYGETEDVKEALNNMVLTVYNEDGDVISEGRADLPGELGNGYSLGEFKDGQEKALSVKLTVSKGMDNRYQNALSEIQWEFQAKELQHDPIKTGDTNYFWVLMGILFAALTLLTTVTILRRR